MIYIPILLQIQQTPPIEPWEVQENVSQSWGRPLRRGTSVMELGGPGCTGCAHCATNPWRYGSCANLEHQWFGPGPWNQACCPPHSSNATHNPRVPPHTHVHPPQTPQPYRRGITNTMLYKIKNLEIIIIFIHLVYICIIINK